MEFKTALNREAIMTILKENTFPTEYDFQSLLFGTHYFSGQINDKKIKIRNSIRSPKNPSPIFDLVITTKEALTEIVIHDDSSDEIWTNNTMLMTITVSMSVVILMVGGILSFVKPDEYSLIWTIIVSVIISGFGLVNSYFYKQRLITNTQADLDYLVGLLQGK